MFAINTYSKKYLVPILKNQTSNECSFYFPFMNISFEDTVNISTNTFFGNNKAVKKLSKKPNSRYLVLILQKNPILFLMEISIRKLMEWLWVHLQIRHQLMIFLFTFTQRDCTIVNQTLNITITSAIFRKSLFYLSHQNISKGSKVT